MTTKRIIYTRPDGGVSIINPAPEFVNKFETEDEAMVTIQTKDVPSDASDVQIVDKTAILTDRSFRNAWRQTAGIISVNMPKARSIHAARLAAALLAESRRLEASETEARIAGRTADADKAASDVVAVGAISLTGLAAQVQAATTPTALVAIWPALVPRP